MKSLLCVVLLGVVASTLAEIENKMDQLSKRLQSEMADVWEMAAVNYSEPVINTTYKASVEFDMRAMGPLYNSTHTVIDVIANKQAYPEGIVSVSDGLFEVASPSQEWKPLLAHYAGPTAVLVVAVLLAAILPLAGLFWCCCYWCRVGRRRRPFDRKYDACLKGILAIVLICLLTLFLFGVVCLFATDSQVESGVEEAPESLRVGIRDAREFLNATQAHARWLLVVNYRELEERLKLVLINSGNVVSMKLGEFSRAVSVTTLNKLVVRLDDVKSDLMTVQELTANLRTNADHLNSGLRKVKNQLLQTLAKCDLPKCVALHNKYKIGQLDTEIHYSQMPDVSELLSNVTSLLNGNIKQEVAAGQQVFRDIQTGIRRSVQEHIPSVQAELERTGKRLEEIANTITWKTGNASLELEEYGRAAGALERLYAEYGPYRRYAGLAAATAPLLITCLMALGLVCGVCGKRPDVYGASDCCNKGAGSRCLLCGIGVIFVVGGAISLVLAAYFLVGVASQRFLCDPLTEPRDNRVFADIDKFVDLEKLLFNEHRDRDFNLTSVLLSCHANRTLYESLQLHRACDVEALRAAVSGALARRVAALRPAFPGAPPPILRGSARRKLAQLAETGLSDFDFDKILHALETNMTSIALDGLARQLNSTAYSLSPAFPAERASLLQAAADLTALLTTTLKPMIQYTEELNKTALRLRDELRFNHTSLKTAIEYLMHEASEAEAFLNKQGPETLQNLTREYAAVIEVRLTEYLDRVVESAQREVGRCGPLSNAFNATRDAACNKILMPTNGYWMSLAWCVVLFVPLLLTAQRLARLYLHLDPYPGPLVEAEYLYDAYADRDNVPLANGSKRSTLDIEGKIAEWRERSVPLPSAPPAPSPALAAAGGELSPPHSGTRLLLDGDDIVCQLVPPPAALIDDLKTRLDAKDEDNESGIHESDAYKGEKRGGRGRGAGREGAGSGSRAGAGVGAGGGGGGGGGGERREPGAAAAPLDPLPPPLDAHHARRYNDMAPKHWEEGPPRYHGPTEYERPPPYYYPGPTDRQ